MARGSVDVIQRLYQAMNALDVEGAAALVDPEAEWIPDKRVGVPPVRGREQVIDFFMDRASAFGTIHAEPERFLETADGVLVDVRLSGEGEASGAGFEIHIAHLWTVRDGVVVRGQGFADRGEARAAAGLDG